MRTVFMIGLTTLFLASISVAHGSYLTTLPATGGGVSQMEFSSTSNEDESLLSNANTSIAHRRGFSYSTSTPLFLPVFSPRLRGLSPVSKSLNGMTHKFLRLHQLCCGKMLWMP